ncbi:uncharacterized protein LOC117229346 [Megalopta genalis]|uniref:uncharacterized protein LOC117229346 n=1 Tax=Megalopta genalis TaxID=115081 RepID=UPI003FCFCF07
MSSSYETFAKRRERTQNWLPKEKQALFFLIKQHAPAILNKRIDAAATAIKNQAWCIIYNDFLGKFPTERDIPRIKQQWRRMKAQARQEVRIHNDARPVDLVLKEITDLFLSAIPLRPQVKKLGVARAEKYLPSNLSSEVWKLMGKSRKRNCYSYEHNLHTADSSTNLPTNSVNSTSLPVNSTSFSMNESALENLATSTPKTPADTIKIEINSDECNSVDENQAGFSQRNLDDPDVEDIVVSKLEPSEVQSSKDRIDQAEDNVDPFVNMIDEPEVSVDQPEGNVHQPANNVDQSEDKIDQLDRQRRTLKIHVLNAELDLVELRKQVAMNELKTSEIKRQLAERQAADYNNRMQRAVVVKFSRNMASLSHARMSGERGSGAGKGGGGGGTIREAGGSFGKMEAAHEDQYFYNLQKEQFKKLKEDLHDEISFHEEQIKRHQEAINRHKQRITDMNHN